MSETATPPDTRTVPQTDGGDHDRFAHYIRTPGQSAGAAILQAGFDGDELEALCGKRFIPNRDPRKFQICPSCKEILEHMKGEI